MALSKEARTKRALVRWCDERLRTEFGDRVPPRPRPDPLDELVLTVLSQNTSDVNRDRAYAALRRRWPRWEDVLAAEVTRIEDAIRVGGLARQKSARIQAMLREIAVREGKLSLERLCTLPRDQALAYLYSFKGVGAKTAAIVMLFSCGVPVFPVDTHILRVGKRLGLLPVPATADQAHEIMGALVPDERMYRFHINLIAHGRATCHARKPECVGCCLRVKCPCAFKVK